MLSATLKQNLTHAPSLFLPLFSLPSLAHQEKYTAPTPSLLKLSAAIASPVGDNHSITLKLQLFFPSNRDLEGYLIWRAKCAHASRQPIYAMGVYHQHRNNTGLRQPLLWYCNMMYRCIYKVSLFCNSNTAQACNKMLSRWVMTSIVYRHRTSK